MSSYLHANFYNMICYFLTTSKNFNIFSNQYHERKFVWQKLFVDSNFAIRYCTTKTIWVKSDINWQLMVSSCSDGHFFLNLTLSFTGKKVTHFEFTRFILAWTPLCFVSWNRIRPYIPSPSLSALGVFEVKRTVAEHLSVYLVLLSWARLGVLQYIPCPSFAG
jgi:hypothetical protein